MTAGLVLVMCTLLGFTSTLGTAWLLLGNSSVTYEVINTNEPQYASAPAGPVAAVSALSPIFTPEVQYWAPLIEAWGTVYGINPNLIATVIQIESCGDPMVASPAGAQGLFQVMPFHFASGEDMLDVQTNARRGLDYLLGSLAQANGHAGLALAGYNGGHGVINRGWAAWSSETQRYYYWGSQIYAEALAGIPESPTLQEWLQSGGSVLCTQASQRQRMLEQQTGYALTSN